MHLILLKLIYSRSNFIKTNMHSKLERRGALLDAARYVSLYRSYRC
jgi:hypothetical protein